MSNTNTTLTRILYVEDEPDIQAVAQLALECIGGFTVKICSSGKEAIETVEEFAPDLILLDVMMPDMDGTATLKALREIPQFANIPIIFMTAKVQTHEVVRYKKLGVLDVIFKPFDPMMVSDRIREIWGQYVEILRY